MDAPLIPVFPSIRDLALVALSSDAAPRRLTLTTAETVVEIALKNLGLNAFTQGQIDLDLGNGFILTATVREVGK